MRKELKSKSRRKWLLGGSLAFASVALLTTGFATWVIGTSKPSGDGQVQIGVDTAQDNSVELTFSLDDTDSSIFVTEDADKLDWNIKIKDLSIAVGETFYDSLKTKQDLKIVFALQKNDAEGINSATNSVTEDKVGVRGKTGSSWNYIKPAKSEFKFTLKDSSSYPTDGKIYDISNDATNNPDGNKTLSFYWGSYFGDKAPSEFYEENKPTGSSREYYKKALEELQAMKTALTGTLKLTATFVYEK